MTYAIEIKPSCQNSIRKTCKKNTLLEKTLRKKMEEIIESPERYKPLRYDMTGERRVHILKSFVLIFEVDEPRKAVSFLFFGHHDEAYRR
ncbi:MAG: type II toxin-antitoxin system RelE/ParE family toxin [Candidatus Woesearchaeota archaeon]